MNGTGSLFYTKELSVSLKERGRRLPVVFPTDIAVKDGGCTGVIGESGCGKSLFGRAVLGLLTERKWQVEGEAFFKGERLPLENDREMDAFRGRRMSMIVQDPLSAFDPRMTVGAHFMEGLKRRERKERYREAVARLGRMLLKNPESVMKQYPFELSGGMLQRVMIALSLFAGPEMMIADEPTTALDSTVQEEILQLLEGLLGEGGLSLLLISHDLKVISRMADTVYVMYAGRIVECGTMEEVQRAPLHPYTVGLFSSRPAFSKERLLAMEGRPPLLEGLSEPGCAFAPRCPSAGEACRKEVPSFGAAGGGHLVRCSRPEAWGAGGRGRDAQ
ncbi:MAG: ABC transporter ATP-binding protein [Lachnospiraceae bacterium]|nr:ABC transporter ATP-binding protein [Lachnospiraceae bacterium]